MNDSRKKKIVSAVALMLLLFMMIGASVAYFIGQIDTGATADINAITGTTDSLMFKVGDPINLVANMSNFKEGDGNVNSTTYANATLIANNGTNQASYNYNLYLDIMRNDLVYTTSDKKPELLLKITSKDNSEDTSEEATELTSGITGVEYKTITTSSGTYSGFDITERQETVEIALNHEIATTSRKTNNWEIEVIFVNLDSDQQLNTEKVFRSELRIGTEEVEEKQLSLAEMCVGRNLAECLKEKYKLDSSIYYHDATLTNGAEDGSYRYSGADPSNYVCFGSELETCPEDNIYRIIGVFGNQVKLIKADYATKELLGEDGDYKSNETPQSSYKGSQTTIAYYRWNYNGLEDKTINGGYGSNNWSTSLLNKINLNNNFLNNIGEEWSNKIAMTTWNLGGWGSYDVTAKQAFDFERGTWVVSGNPTTYEAKVGLMYPSDYGYATIPDNWTTNLNAYNETNIINNNWLYLGEYEWLITTYSRNGYYTHRLDFTGLFAARGPVEGDSVRPSIYLDSSIILTDGEGTKISPYRIN